MKSQINLAVLAAGFTALISAGSAVAGPSNEIKVSGVLKVTACNVSFTSGNVVDFGTIPASSLPVGQHKKLEHRSVPFTVTCAAPMKMALKATDNRANSVVPEPGMPDQVTMFGLGKVAEKDVGSYRLRLVRDSLTADGQTAYLLHSPFNPHEWNTSDAGFMGGNNNFSWKTDAYYWSRTPGSYQSVSGLLEVQARLNKPENLPMSQEIPLDGSATLELVYL